MAKMTTNHYIEFQDYVDNEFDVSIEEIEQKINTSDMLFIEQKHLEKIDNQIQTRISKKSRG